MLFIPIQYHLKTKGKVHMLHFTPVRLTVLLPPPQEFDKN
jgi:hypothetical protein